MILIFFRSMVRPCDWWLGPTDCQILLIAFIWLKLF